jgi:hypothetical protein
MATERKREPEDDDEVDELSIRKKDGPTNTTLFVVLVAGGIGLMLIVLCIGVGIVLFVVGARDATAAKLPGSWKGRWALGGQVFDSTYTFKKDGSFREESFDLQGRRINVSGGRWHFRNGAIEIDWDQGGFEIATAHWIDDNTMNYHIVDHSDVAQIGITTAFKRQ